MFIYATYNHIDFEHAISVKVDPILIRKLIVDKKVFYLYKEVFHRVTIQLGYVQLE